MSVSRDRYRHGNPHQSTSKLEMSRTPDRLNINQAVIPQIVGRRHVRTQLGGGLGAVRPRLGPHSRAVCHLDGRRHRVGAEGPDGRFGRWRLDTDPLDRRRCLRRRAPFPPDTLSRMACWASGSTLPNWTPSWPWKGRLPATCGSTSRKAGSTPVPVPEPSTYAMLLGGLGLLAAVARRRRQGM
jgi:hypothetical protein